MSFRRSTRPPAPWMLVLRPFGYLLIGLVWLAIWAFCLAATWFLPFFFVFSSAIFGDPVLLADVAGSFEGLMSSPASILATVLLLVPIMLILVGPVVMWVLNNCVWPNAALAFVYVGRSLRPSYRGEKLSFTSYAPAGSTIGPPTVGNVALSLQPVRMTPVTRFLMRFYIAGWRPNLKSCLAMLPASVGWALFAPATATDVPTAINVVCGVLAVVTIVGGYGAATWFAFRSQGALSATPRGA